MEPDRLTPDEAALAMRAQGHWPQGFEGPILDLTTVPVDETAADALRQCKAREAAWSPEEHAAVAKARRASLDAMEEHVERLKRDIKTAGLRIRDVGHIPERSLRPMLQNRQRQAMRPRGPSAPPSRRPRQAATRSSAKSGDSPDDGPDLPAATKPLLRGQR